MKTAIKNLRARALIDCKGKPLLEVDVLTEEGVLGRAASPSGISAGEHEAMVLRDGDPKWYDGNGVYKAVEMEIASLLVIASLNNIKAGAITTVDGNPLNDSAYNPYVNKVFEGKKRMLKIGLEAMLKMM